MLITVMFGKKKYIYVLKYVYYLMVWECGTKILNLEQTFSTRHDDKIKCFRKNCKILYMYGMCLQLFHKDVHNTKEKLNNNKQQQQQKII